MGPEKVDQYETNAEPYIFPGNILVLRNPVSTRAEQALHKIGHLERYGAEHGITRLDVIETTPDTREDNKAMFVESIKKRMDRGWHENMAVAVVGGDGTIGMASEAFLEASEDIRQIPILPIGAGNINDIAGMLHTRYARGMPVRMLGTAQKVAIRPLQCTVEGSNSAETKTGLGYVTFNASAEATAAINDVRLPLDERTRWNQLTQPLRVGQAALRAVLEADLFSMYVHDETAPAEGRHQTNLDLLVTNGQRMAGMLKTPARLDEESFFVSRVPKRHFEKIVSAAVRLLLGCPAGELRAEPLHFEALSAIRAQVDGEHFAISKGSQVVVGQAKHALSFISLGYR